MVSPWLPVVPGEPLSVGLTPVLPVAGRVDVEDEDADEGGVAGLELPDAGGDEETLGLADLTGLGLAGQEGELVAWPAFLLPVAPVLAVAVAVAVALAVLVALVLAVAVDVAVAVPVAVPVAEVLPLPLGLTLAPWLLPGLPLEMPLDGAVPEPVGGTLGSALLDLADLDALADGQAVACALLWLADEL